MPRTNNSISVAQFRIESEINEVQLSVNQEKCTSISFAATFVIIHVYGYVMVYHVGRSVYIIILYIMSFINDVSERRFYDVMPREL